MTVLEDLFLPDDDDDDDDDDNNNNNNNNNNYTSTYAKKQGYNWTKKHSYEHVPKSVETSQGGKVTILWNQQVQTDQSAYSI